MADAPNPSSSAPGVQNGGPAPGTAPGAPPGTAGQMPPPQLPPLDTNPVFDPATGGLASPTSAGGTVRRAAPEPNKRALYVGGLDPRVTEEVLRQIFETAGHVQNVKIIPDKNVSSNEDLIYPLFRDLEHYSWQSQRAEIAVRYLAKIIFPLNGIEEPETDKHAQSQYQSKGFNYGFIEFDDPGSAERAMQTINGRRIHNSEVRVNWAYQSNNTNKEDTSNHYHIFVGDLSNEVNDEVLLQAFAAFGDVSEARVMWDMKTGRSRGYGFVAFRQRENAEKALSKMDGEWLGSRAIRCNWANQKGQPSITQQQQMAQMGMTPTSGYGHHQFPQNGTADYENIKSQTPHWQTTVYVGNLTPYTTTNDLVPLFQNFGYVVESRLQSDRGFAFVKMDNHDNAASAICGLNSYMVNGRPLKCSWGKDRPPTGQFDGFSPGALQSPGAYPGAAPYFPQYGAGPAPAMSPQGAGPSPQFPYAASPGGFNMPGSAGGYGRGAPAAGDPYSAGGFPGYQQGFAPQGFPPQQNFQAPQNFQGQQGYQG